MVSSEFNNRQIVLRRCYKLIQDPLRSYTEMFANILTDEVGSMKLKAQITYIYSIIVTFKVFLS